VLLCAVTGMHGILQKAKHNDTWTVTECWQCKLTLQQLDTCLKLTLQQLDTRHWRVRDLNHRVSTLQTHIAAAGHTSLTCPWSQSQSVNTANSHSNSCTHVTDVSMISITECWHCKLTLQQLDTRHWHVRDLNHRVSTLQTHIAAAGHTSLTCPWSESQSVDTANSHRSS